MSYHISASPHIRSKQTTRSVMTDVLIALIPACLWGVYQFGWYALCLMISCMVCSVVCEWAYQKGMKQEITVKDGSAALTGLLIALNMPPQIPLWIPLLGCIFAILMVKQLFGGLGQNFMNPALGARCFLLISFAAQMNSFSLDGVSSATPLAQMREGSKVLLSDLFFGTTAGVIGEVSALAILLGGLYLLLKGIISWKIPVSYIASFVLFSGVMGSWDGMWLLSQVLSGGLLLGAFFMATDYVTSPITGKGKLIYGVLLGFLTALFRIFGANPEGVSFAIIIGNMVTPLIEKVTVPRAFGVVKQKKEKQKEVQEKVASAPHKGDKKANVKVVAVLTCITLLSGLILGYFYELTKEPIALQEEKQAQEAYKTVFPEADSFEELSFEGEETDTYFLEKMLMAMKGETVLGTVVCVTSHEGYGGDISLVVGITENGETTGISFLSLNETAGLGMNAEKDEFKSQFSNKKTDAFTVVKGEATAENEISAISGATVTSKAVTEAVNAALKLVGGGTK